MERKIKKTAFVILLLVLLFPILQQGFNLITVKPLKGAIVNAQDSTFSLETWLSGTYQTTKEKFLNDNFGFRNIMIRVNNQLAFSFDKIALANGVIIGKENYLYEEGVINSYLGKDFCGEKSLNEQIDKLKAVHDSLKARGIDLIVVSVPNKAFFFPEYIPDRYGKKVHASNYEYYSKALQETNIPYLDLNNYFIQNKNTSRYPLYPQYGHHWSDYGCDTSMVILSKFIGKVRNIELPIIKYDSLRTGFDYTSSDYDIADGMNIIQDLKTFEMAYPKVSFDDHEKTKPSVLTIGDSFYWGIYGNGHSSGIFSKYDFWYYFHELESPGKPNKQTDDVDLKQEIENFQVIMIMSNPVCFNQLGWGFIEKAYTLYVTNKGASDGAPRAFDKRLNEIISGIRNSPNWYKEIVKKAHDRGIPVDTMLVQDATWVLQNQK